VGIVSAIGMQSVCGTLVEHSDTLVELARRRGRKEVLLARRAGADERAFARSRAPVPLASFHLRRDSKVYSRSAVSQMQFDFALIACRLAALAEECGNQLIRTAREGRE
jgi:hypothetical protein